MLFGRRPRDRTHTAGELPYKVKHRTDRRRPRFGVGIQAVEDGTNQGRADNYPIRTACYAGSLFG